VNTLYDVQTSDGPQDGQLDRIIRDLLRRAVTLSRLSPAQIADELTKRLQRRVGEPLIYAWMAATNRNRLPADVLPHICEILKDDSIQRLVLSDKLRHSLELGESTARVISLLRCALGEGSSQKAAKKPRRRSKR
jgi:hypothetical protein